MKIGEDFIIIDIDYGKCDMMCYNETGIALFKGLHDTQGVCHKPFHVSFCLRHIRRF